MCEVRQHNKLLGVYKAVSRRKKKTKKEKKNRMGVKVGENSRLK